MRCWPDQDDLKGKFDRIRRVHTVEATQDGLVLRGVSKVFIEVEDQQRALKFWTQKLGFELLQDESYGPSRWIELRTPDRAVVLVLALRAGDAVPPPEDGLPTSNVAFYCDDLAATHEQLAACGVGFPQPPIEQPFGWWSMFEDTEGNRFALTPAD